MMDASFNYSEEVKEYNFDNEVRPPDLVINERLIEYNMNNHDKQLYEALYLSMKELDNQEKMNEIYEKEIINNFIIETVKRREKFQQFMLKINKLIKFDKDIKEIYEIIEPIIYAYCEQQISTFELDKVTHNKIFKTLSSIRIQTETIILLKTIILTT